MAGTEVKGLDGRGSPGVSFGALFLPLGAAFGYACGAIAIKRALGAGASAAWVNFLSNAIMAILFQILWLMPGKSPNPILLLAPVLCGLLFFLGQILTFRAISTGDVSVATPLLGAKVMLVALFTLVLLGKPLPVSWWMASLLASVGIAMISYMPGVSVRHLRETVLCSLSAAGIYAITDVLVQKWVPLVGYGTFAAVMFGSMGIFSLVYVPGFLRQARLGCALSNASGKGLPGCPMIALPWLATGSLLLAVQSLGMYSAIGLFGSAAITNILYGSRCLWSVVLVWAFGHLALEGSQSQNSPGVMRRRLIGSLLLFSAMALVLG
jgi:drug/metabolite transporter (DMT)-like permease